MRFLRRLEAGVVAGLFAGVAVATLFLMDGAVHLHPLSVPISLASSLLNDGSMPTGPFGQAGAFVLLGIELVAYTVIHLLAFATVGATAALFVDATSFSKSLWGGVAYGSVTCTGLLYAVRWIADTPVALDVLGLRAVLLANAVAGAIIGVVLYLSEKGNAEVAASGP
jgi:hypothetical protein